MRRATRLLAALAGAGALATALPALAPGQTGGAPLAESLRCLAPTDAAGIDTVLRTAGSPLAGEGATFVEASRAIGLDPRALVAIAAHETVLLTYRPSQAINNPFGLGPGWSFPSEREAIRTAARVLARGYLGEGLTTIPAIGAKWAPIGASNDPTGLNNNWASGVGGYYAALGGDPGRPLLLADQRDTPGCGGRAPDQAPAEPSAGSPSATSSTSPTSLTPVAPGPPVITAWGGGPPAVSGDAPREGADPRTGAPAELAGFVFPLVLPTAAPARFADDFAQPGPVACEGEGMRCAVEIAAAPGAPVVASVAGILRASTPAEREEGVAFWLVAGEDRLGYGPLAAYEAGVRDGARVAAGGSLGASPGTLRLAWERDGVRVNPFPLLAATRAPA